MMMDHPLYREMRYHRITLQRVADSVGLTRSAIQQQLTGKTPLKDPVIAAIERLLEKTTDKGIFHMIEFNEMTPQQRGWYDRILTRFIEDPKATCTTDIFAEDANYGYGVEIGQGSMRVTACLRWDGVIQRPLSQGTVLMNVRIPDLDLKRIHEAVRRHTEQAEIGHIAELGASLDAALLATKEG